MAAVRWFNPGPRVYWRGRWFDSAHVKAMKAKEKAIGADYIMQGSYNRGVSASAGTHNGGGVVDTNSRGLNARKKGARFGLVGWARTRAQGFSPHDHSMLQWDNQASPGLKAQMYAWNNGRNGLAGNGRDNSGVRGDFRHYLDWQKSLKAAPAKKKVTPIAYLGAIENSRKFGSKVRPYGSVKLVQQALNKIYGGRDLLVDGVMGPKTLAQYNRFRRGAYGANGAKGSIGAQSLKLLFKRAGMGVNIWSKAKESGGKRL